MTDTTIQLLEMSGCYAAGGAALVIMGLIIGLALGWRLSR